MRSLVCDFSNWICNAVEHNMSFWAENRPFTDKTGTFITFNIVFHFNVGNTKMKKNKKIEYALYRPSVSVASTKEINQKRTLILPHQYTPSMKGQIYCPECYGQLRRSPENKPYDARGREAFFAHVSKEKIKCSLRRTGRSATSKTDTLTTSKTENDYRSSLVARQTVLSKSVGALPSLVYFATPNTFDTYTLLQRKIKSLNNININSPTCAANQVSRPLFDVKARQLSFITRVILLIKSLIKKYVFI